MKCALTQKVDVDAVKLLTKNTWISTYVPFGVPIENIESRFNNPLWDAGFYDYIDNLNSISYSAWHDTNLIGIISGYHKDERIIIFSFNIDKKYQRKRIGTMLLSKMQELKKDIYLSTLEENIQAQKFYEKHGFIKTGNVTPFRFSDVCIKNDIEYVWKLKSVKI